MSNPAPPRRTGAMKIRLTSLPDPFAKISVEGSGQCHSTDTCRNTLDPKWNQYYDLYVGKGDGITISVWNRRKIHKKAGSGFLGCVRIVASAIHRLKDTGYQRLDLTRIGHDECEPVRGQIVVSLMSRDGRGTGSHNAVVDPLGNLSSPDDLPDGWEERRTPTGRLYYVNHHDRTTTWERPTQPAHIIVERRRRDKTYVCPCAIYVFLSSVFSCVAPKACNSPPCSSDCPSSSSASPNCVRGSSQACPSSSCASPSCARGTSQAQPSTSFSLAPSCSVGYHKSFPPHISSPRTLSSAPVPCIVGCNEVCPPYTASGSPCTGPSPSSRCDPASTSRHSAACCRPGDTSVLGSPSRHSTSSIIVPASTASTTSPAGGNIVLSNPNTSSSDVPQEGTPVRRDPRDREHRRSRAESVERVSQRDAGESRRNPDSVRRRSARHRHYLSRNQLHQPPDLPEGFEMRTTQQGQVYYYNIHTGTSTWHDPRVPRDLGQVNIDEIAPLPGGWELRHTPSGRPYFLDHTNRTTQFTDPRLSDSHILNNILRNRSEGSNRTSLIDTSSSSEPRTNVNNESSVSISTVPNNRNNRSSSNRRNSSSRSRGPSPEANTAGETIPNSVPNSEEPNSSVVNGTPISPTVVPASINNSNNRGSEGSGVTSSVNSSNPVVLQNNSTNLQISSNNNTPGSKDPAVIDMEGDCLPKYKRDLVAKMKVLRAELQCLQPQSGHCRLDIPRGEVFEESYRQIMKMRPKDLRKRLMVKFKGEEGLDYGGVAREWLYLLSHEMLNPYYGLFQYSRDDIYTLQINPDSSVNPEHLSYFHFVGRVIGMAIFHGHYIDGGFSMPFYKMLLNKLIILDDIEAVDPDLHRSLNWMLENDITDIIDSTFTVEHESFGVLQMRELKHGGSNVIVTEDNKKEYVRLYVNYRFMQGIEQQFAALQKGFTEVVPQQLLKPFDERELELIIGGLGKIDIEDWKSNTRLKHCTPETPVVGWFWQIVDSYTEEMRARLLQFVTGSSRVPLQGFKALQGSTGAAGPRLFTIHQIDAPTENLPKAHTCFNRIDLPPYESYSKMFEKLTQAVEETCGFAVE
ncbi:E3 ubiquitin-protein ligase SMURF1-like isoform X2 [Homarus americanus]|uniref:E3 ubiquitin-protein ligase SMURF1-like isoform X2 n=1 Tax=Homarus americanus TaxID=6706 RepID=UPI001C43A45A|nr:E3 ubiquitin-protein ligase SMURF1-like isoform X2 [Homarus americanus]